HRERLGLLAGMEATVQRPVAQQEQRVDEQPHGEQAEGPGEGHAPQHAQEQRRIAERRSEEHTSELQSRFDLVCRLLLGKNSNKKSGVVNITSSVKRRERRGINTIPKKLNPLFTRNMTERSKTRRNVYSRFESKPNIYWR